jgi:transposase-like protein
VAEAELGGEMRNASLLVAIGVNDEGFREVLVVAECSKEDKAQFGAISAAFEGTWDKRCGAVRFG